MKIWNLFGKLFNTNQGSYKQTTTISRVAIFGSADTPDEGELYKSVVAVAKNLAEAGYIVVDGGGPGVMRAATVGAKQGGGRVIAVTLHPKDMPTFEGRDSKNTFDQEIETQSYIERTLTLMEQGQIYNIYCF
jgi:uncharacterized protein (TIGR00725 family)